MANTKPHWGIKCNLCQDVVFSEHRHDFKYCKCGETFVDGGTDYLRTGASEKAGPPQSISKAAYLKQQKVLETNPAKAFRAILKKEKK